VTGIFPVDIDAAKLSATIHTMLMDIHIGKDGSTHEIKDPVPLPNVNANVLTKVIEWCEEHKNEAKPNETNEQKDASKNNENDKIHQLYALSDWDQNFIDSINSVDKDGNPCFLTLPWPRKT